MSSRNPNPWAKKKSDSTTTVKLKHVVRTSTSNKRRNAGLLDFRIPLTASLDIFNKKEEEVFPFFTAFPLGKGRFVNRMIWQANLHFPNSDNPNAQVKSMWTGVQIHVKNNHDKRWIDLVNNNNHDDKGIYINPGNPHNGWNIEAIQMQMHVPAHSGWNMDLHNVGSFNGRKRNYIEEPIQNETDFSRFESHCEELKQEGLLVPSTVWFAIPGIMRSHHIYENVNSHHSSVLDFTRIGEHPDIGLEKPTVINRIRGQVYFEKMNHAVTNPRKQGDRHTIFAQCTTLTGNPSSKVILKGDLKNFCESGDLRICLTDNHTFNELDAGASSQAIALWKSCGGTVLPDIDRKESFIGGDRIDPKYLDIDGTLQILNKKAGDAEFNFKYIGYFHKWNELAQRMIHEPSENITDNAFSVENGRRATDKSVESEVIAPSMPEPETIEVSVPQQACPDIDNPIDRDEATDVSSCEAQSYQYDLDNSVASAPPPSDDELYAEVNQEQDMSGGEAVNIETSSPGDTDAELPFDEDDTLGLMENQK